MDLLSIFGADDDSDASMEPQWRSGESAVHGDGVGIVADEDSSSDDTDDGTTDEDSISMAPTCYLYEPHPSDTDEKTTDSEHDGDTTDSGRNLSYQGETLSSNGSDADEEPATDIKCPEDSEVEDLWLENSEAATSESEAATPESDAATDSEAAATSEFEDATSDSEDATSDSEDTTSDSDTDDEYLMYASFLKNIAPEVDTLQEQFKLIVAVYHNLNIGIPPHHIQDVRHAHVPLKQTEYGEFLTEFKGTDYGTTDRGFAGSLCGRFTLESLKILWYALDAYMDALENFVSIYSKPYGELGVLQRKLALASNLDCCKDVQNGKLWESAVLDGNEACNDVDDGICNMNEFFDELHACYVLDPFRDLYAELTDDPHTGESDVPNYDTQAYGVAVNKYFAYHVAEHYAGAMQAHRAALDKFARGCPTVCDSGPEDLAILCADAAVAAEQNTVSATFTRKRMRALVGEVKLSQAQTLESLGLTITDSAIDALIAGAEGMLTETFALATEVAGDGGITAEHFGRACKIMRIAN